MDLCLIIVAIVVLAILIVGLLSYFSEVGAADYHEFCREERAIKDGYYEIGGVTKKLKNM